MQDSSPPGQLIAIKLLRLIAPGMRIGTYYPRDAPSEMIVVNRHGGTMINPITDGVTITIQVYAHTEARAENIAAALRDGLSRRVWWGSRIDGHVLRGWKEYAGPQRFTDPDRARVARFQLSGQLLVSTLKAER